jgi:hypothetical protein
MFIVRLRHHVLCIGGWCIQTSKLRSAVSEARLLAKLVSKELRTTKHSDYGGRE